MLISVSWWGKVTVLHQGDAPGHPLGLAPAARLQWFSAALASVFVRQDEQPREDAERAVDSAVLAALQDVRDRLEVIEARLGERGDVDPDAPEPR